MANQLWDGARQAWADGEISWTADNFKVALVEGAYTFSQTHQFLSDLTNVVATSENLAGKTNVGGVLDAADIIVLGLTPSETATRVVIYKDTGVPTTSRLILFYDTRASGDLVNVIGDGGTVSIRWSNGATKILKL